MELPQVAGAGGELRCLRHEDPIHGFPLTGVRRQRVAVIQMLELPIQPPAVLQNDFPVAVDVIHPVDSPVVKLMPVRRAPVACNADLIPLADFPLVPLIHPEFLRLRKGQCLDFVLVWLAATHPHHAVTRSDDLHLLAQGKALHVTIDLHDLAVSQQTQPPNVTPPVTTQSAPPPVVAPVAKTVDPAIAENAKQEVLRLEERAKAQAALEIQKQQEKEKAAALEAQKREEAEQQAALEAQRRQEAERRAALQQQKREERAKLIGQINTTLTNQTALLSKYYTDCQTRLDNNTIKLAKIAPSSRPSLTSNNDEFRLRLVKNVQIEQTSLDNVQKDMQALGSHPQFDPRILQEQLTNYIAGMESRHKNALSILDELDTAIANAPKKWTLFNLQTK